MRIPKRIMTTPWGILDLNQVHNFYCVILLLSIVLTSASGQVSLVVTAPVPDTEENGVFSIHCQVSGLQPGQGKEVAILRNVNGYQERISLNDEVVKSTLEDRVFLATRQVSDGDVVYFLSVMGVEQSDEGEYTCVVDHISASGSRTDEVLPIGSVNIRVMFFPSEGSLVCSNAPPELHAGEVLILNCSSESAFPIVSIEWHRTSELEASLHSEQYTSGERVYASITHTLSKADSGSMFVCSISSSAFPGHRRTCHVGPIHVISGQTENDRLPNINGNSPNNNPPNQPIKPPSIIMDSLPEGNIPDTSTITRQACRNKCSALDGSVILWIIATISAGIVALTFFILVIILFSKYRSLNNSSHQYTSPMVYTEKIYDEVGSHGIKHDERIANQRNIVYMSLEKRDALRNHEGHDYIGTNDRRF